MRQRTISELLRQRDALGPLGALDFLIEIESVRKRRGRTILSETRSKREAKLKDEVERLRGQLRQTQEELRHCRKLLGMDRSD